tara:strand:+ start:188 stop:1597 length:1410 start_codon:yes stop_codon:yes gene_type:complete
LESELSVDIKDVVSGGFCVGCGGCAAVASQSIKMQRSDEQTYLPQLADAAPEVLEAANRVCPFSDASRDETDLAQDLYEGRVDHRAESAGYYQTLHAGHINDDAQVLGSSSGGLTSWFLLRLLEQGRIDGVIHVGSTGTQQPLYDFTVSESADEVLGRRKSQYYAVQFSDVIARIRGNGRRYAFVGVPCFVKSMRALANEDAVLKSQLVWHVGLVCGHMKSGAFSQAMADQLGVPPQQVGAVDFRVKDPEAPANAYSFGVRAAGQEAWKTRMSRTLLGGNWGHALFQLKACDYCDDIFAETADICFGDAWLPRFEANWRGTNVVLCRTTEAAEIFAEAQDDITLETIDLADLEKTQAGNFRHRREGLSYRLELDVAAGRMVPKKRVAPGQFTLPADRKKIVEIRRDMAARSHTAWLEARKSGDMPAFYREMQGYADRMQAIYRRAEKGGLKNLVKRVIRKLVRTLRPAA